MTNDLEKVQAYSDLYVKTTNAHPEIVEGMVIADLGIFDPSVRATLSGQALTDYDALEAAWNALTPSQAEATTG